MPSPIDAAPTTVPWERIAAFVLMAVAVVYGLAGLGRSVSGDTVNSRLATVYALTEHGTFAIDGENPFAGRTVDKVEVRSRRLSSKPPILPLLMTAEYVALRAVTGWTLTSDTDARTLIKAFTFSFVTLPYWMTIMLAWRMGPRLTISAPARLFLLACAAFGTQLAGYATVFNNHVPAAACVMAALYLATGLVSKHLAPVPWRFAAFGLSAGLATTIDIPTAVFPALMGIAILIRFPRQTIAWAIPLALVPVIVQSAVLFHNTGSLLPVQLHGDWYLFENSYWRNPGGNDALNEPFGTYLFHITFGRAGVFLLFPVSLLGFVGTWFGLRDERAEVRLTAACAFAGFSVLALYYALFTNNYGGEAYGFRWFIVAMPMLIIAAAPLLERARSVTQRIVIVCMLGVSVASTLQCALHPWNAHAAWTTIIFGSAY